MKLVSPRVDLIEDRGIEGIQILEKIEKIGRLCYKSEDKIGEGTAEKMVRGLIKRGHEAMIEHWSYIFQCSEEDYHAFWTFVGELEDRGWHFYLRRTALDGRFIISGNVRAFRDFTRAVFAENRILPFWLAKMLGRPTIDKKVFFGDLVGSYPEDLPDSFYSDVKELCKEQLTDREKKVHYDITVKFICDRGVTHEIVRHRPASFAQESTRYCNYVKGQFGGEIGCIIPLGFDEDVERTYIFEDDKEYNPRDIWNSCMCIIQRGYNILIELGVKPQMARSVLPSSLKTEIVMTASVGEWIHFCNLRALDKTGPAHPQMKEVAISTLEIMKSVVPSIFGDM